MLLITNTQSRQGTCNVVSDLLIPFLTALFRNSKIESPELPNKYLMELLC